MLVKALESGFGRVGRVFVCLVLLRGNVVGAAVVVVRCVARRQFLDKTAVAFMGRGGLMA